MYKIHFETEYSDDFEDTLAHFTEQLSAYKYQITDRMHHLISAYADVAAAHAEQNDLPVMTDGTPFQKLVYFVSVFYCVVGADLANLIWEREFGIQLTDEV